MKVQALTLVTAIGILKDIDFTKMKLSVAYKMEKILKEGQVAVAAFHIRRIELAKKYGELNDAKDQYIFPDDETEEKFRNELKEMSEDEIELEVPKVHIDLLDEYINIEPVNVQFVSWFVDGLDD